MDRIEKAYQGSSASRLLSDIMSLAYGSMIFSCDSPPGSPLLANLNNAVSFQSSHSLGFRQHYKSGILKGLGFSCRDLSAILQGCFGCTSSGHLIENFRKQPKSARVSPFPSKGALLDTVPCRGHECSEWLSRPVQQLPHEWEQAVLLCLSGSALSVGSSPLWSQATSISGKCIKPYSGYAKGRK